MGPELNGIMLDELHMRYNANRIRKHAMAVILFTRMRPAEAAQLLVVV